MGVISRIRRALFIRPWLKKGYSRRLANSYYKKTLKDLQTDNGVSAADKKRAHERGYLSDSIAKYDLKNKPDSKYISDVDYLYLKPFNNSFTKWVGDLVTENRVLIGRREHLPVMYFNIIEREEKKLFLPIDTVGREFGENYDDFIRLLNERGELVIRPDRSSAQRCAYIIRRTGENRYELCEDKVCKTRMNIFGNDYDQAYLLSEYPDELPEGFEKNPCKREYYDKESLYELISTFEYGYVIAEPYKMRDTEPGILRIYVANEKLKDTRLLDYYYTDLDGGAVRCLAVTPSGELDGKKIDCWDEIINTVTDIAGYISEIEYFTAHCAQRCAQRLSFGEAARKA